jgi:hypothetical protein
MRVPVPSSKPSSNRQRSSSPRRQSDQYSSYRDGRFHKSRRGQPRGALAQPPAAAAVPPACRRLATAAARSGPATTLSRRESSDRSSAIRHRLSQNAAIEAAGEGSAAALSGTRRNAVPRGRKATRPNSRLVRVGQPFRRPPSRLRPYRTAAEQTSTVDAADRAIRV